MFERTIVPPEMAALLLPVHDSPKVRGFLFRLGGVELFYGNNAEYLTRMRCYARVYSHNEMCQNSRNSWSWGNKAHGKWVVVYE